MSSLFFGQFVNNTNWLNNTSSSCCYFLLLSLALVSRSRSPPLVCSNLHLQASQISRGPAHDEPELDSAPPKPRATAGRHLSGSSARSLPGQKTRRPLWPLESPIGQLGEWLPAGRLLRTRSPWAGGQLRRTGHKSRHSRRRQAGRTLVGVCGCGRGGAAGAVGLRAPIPHTGAPAERSTRSAAEGRPAAPPPLCARWPARPAANPLALEEINLAPRRARQPVRLSANLNRKGACNCDCLPAGRP